MTGIGEGAEPIMSRRRALLREARRGMAGFCSPSGPGGRHPNSERSTIDVCHAIGKRGARLPVRLADAW